MSRKVFTHIKGAISDILDRLDANPDASALWATLDFKGLSIRDNDREVLLLEGLEKRELLVVNERADQTVRIKLKDVAGAYQYMNRRPASMMAGDHIEMIKAVPGYELFANVLESIFSNWRKNKKGKFNNSPRFSVEDAEDLMRAITLARAISSNDRQTDYRTLSTHVGLDSKALDQCENSVSALLHIIDDFPDDISSREHIGMYGVEKLPHPIVISGQTNLQNSEKKLLYVGYHPDDAFHLSALNAEYILTIENWVSFVRYADEVNRDARGLIIYTGGYPSPSLSRVLGNIYRTHGIPFYHWGDVDSGGLYIARSIQLAIQNAGGLLRLHLMDEETVRKYGRPGKPSRLPQKVDDNPDIADAWRRLADKEPLILEQEMVAPVSPQK